MEFLFSEFEERAKQQQHSHEYIEAIRLYADRLQRANLPVIFDVTHLAQLMGIDISTLSKLLDSPYRHYHYRLIKKHNGDYRRIIMPSDQLKYIQRWINRYILNPIVMPAYITGFVPNRSIITNAKIHENKKYILSFDIENFFESITLQQVEKVFVTLGYESTLSSTLARLCTTSVFVPFLPQTELYIESFKSLCARSQPFLVQGAPTSPALANLACASMDAQLFEKATELGASYSRYADDITFSANTFSQLPSCSYVATIVSQSGFNINQQKTSFSKPGFRQQVTGLLVDHHVRIPKVYKKDIYRHLHFCLKYGGASHFDRISDGKWFGREWLLGRISFVNSVEPEEAAKMLTLFNQISWIPKS